MIASLLDGDCIKEMSPIHAMNKASRERMSQYTRKYTVLHKILKWEIHLDTAKGKVHECEETLQKLREEVEEVDDKLGRLESGMEHLKHVMGLLQHPSNTVAGFGYSKSQLNATTSPVHKHDHQTRLATSEIQYE